jgi:hypothetical protein
MAVQVFYSYSHKDERFKEELDQHLSILQREGYISAWNDRKIAPGSKWKEEIDKNLEKAKVILLLFSSNFLASDYCYETETIFALEQHEKKKCILIPIIIKPCLFTKIARFKYLQALPKNAKAITLWRDRNEGWVNVAEGIIKAIDENPQIINARDYSAITFGVPDKKEKPSQSYDNELQLLLVQFLSANNRFYFSPLRIQKWGAGQIGFHNLKQYGIDEIKLELKKLLSTDKIKTIKSKKGNLLYKLA